MVKLADQKFQSLKPNDLTVLSKFIFWIRAAQWEKFFETTSFRRRIDLANSHFDVVSTAYFDGEATSICEFDTKSHFAVKSILFFTIAFVSTVYFEGEATSICDFDTKSHFAVKSL